MLGPLWWRRWRQRGLSRSLQRRGLSQPSRTDIQTATARVAAGCAGAQDRGIAQRDYCLARGYCCRCGCRYCPWGYDMQTRDFKEPLRP